jgi:predicted DNA-binding transcriptional regulator
MKASTFSFGAPQIFAVVAVAIIIVVQVNVRPASTGWVKYAILGAPYAGLLVLYFLLQSWRAAKALDHQLRTALEDAILQADEVYADVILAWLRESSTTGKITVKEVARELDIPESMAQQGLTLLANKYGAVRETLMSGAWQYSGTGPALQLTPRFKRIRSVATTSR